MIWETRNYLGREKDPNQPHSTWEEAVSSKGILKASQSPVVLPGGRAAWDGLIPAMREEEQTWAPWAWV